jgi:hypothetical protein
MKNEIIIYSPNEIAEHIEVRIENETVWLNQAQMAMLFRQTKQNISLHINNCFKEGELEKFSTVKESLTVRVEGQRKVTRKVEFYNLVRQIKKLFLLTITSMNLCSCISVNVPQM